jgi:hypothetical protein
MNQQQFVQMQADMAGLQAQISQQQIDLTAAQNMATQAVADAAQAVADAATAQAAANATIAAPMGAVPAIGVVPPPVVAVSTPGQIMGLLLLDTTSGLKIHKLASTPLRDLFDGQASQVTTFTNDLWTRARSFGWDHLIFSIATSSNGVVVVKAMLDNFSSIAMSYIKAMADIYSATLPTATRASQAATQLHLTLQDSLTQSGHCAQGGIHFYSQWQHV